MTSKSSHHKAENTFKFQTFHERLAGINIDVARKFGKFAATPEDEDTFFYEALVKWVDLNYTQHFVDFRKEITQDVQSFAQLVHHQAAIVAALEKHLRVPDSMALQPLLDLTVQLGRDLQSDFYTHFPGLLAAVVWLLNTYHHDVDLLEQAFTCLSYLFKFLWRTMLKDIEQVYRLFSPLLGNNYKDYINNFAAESFAFLMRKCKTQSNLFDFLFCCLRDEPRQVEGVGRLVFEMVKGVKGQFHSSVQTVLPLLLKKLGKDDLPRERVLGALTAAWGVMADHTTPQHSGPVWDVMLDFLAERAGEDKIEVEAFRGTLDLLSLWIGYKNGVIISGENKIVKTLLLLMESAAVRDAGCGPLPLTAISTLLKASASTLDMRHAPKLVSTVYSAGLSDHHLVDFARTLFDLPLFEKDVLPSLLKYSHQCIESDSPSLHHTVLHLLTDLVLQRAPPGEGLVDPTDLKTYSLDFQALIRSTKAKLKEKNFPALLVRHLEGRGDSKADNATLWAALFLVPHVKPLQKDKLVPLLRECVATLYTKALEEQGTDSQLDDRLNVLCEAALTLYRVQDAALPEALQCDQLLKLISAFSSSVHVLRLADLFFTASVLHGWTHHISHGVFTQTFTALQSNFTSPYSQIRLLTCHILCQFNPPLVDLPEDVEVEQAGVFDLCLTAEQTPASVQTYRDKLMQLRKLEHASLQYQLPQGAFDQVGLRYLLGTLYVNFTLLWEPVMVLIKSHAQGMDRSRFWEVYGEQLAAAADKTESELSRGPLTQSQPEGESRPGGDLDPDSLEATAARYRNQVACLTDRPDHANFRFLLWRAMQKFPDVCQPKSRIISKAFFRFLETEYYPADLSVAPTQDISKPEAEDTPPGVPPETAPATEDSLVEEGEDLGGEGSRTPHSHRQKGDRKTRSRAPNRTLVVHLTLFTKFTSPKSIYLEPKLNDLYHQLLRHQDPAVQKVAFECLLTYNHKYLTPYKDHFGRLLADATFKDELVLFSIDQESTIVEAEHRQELVPILMRVLYGKMQTKTGKDTSGKTNSTLRKNLVFRFLAGCQQQELHVFLDLVFQPFQHFVSDDVSVKVKELLGNAQLTKMIPLKQLQSALGTTGVIIAKLGSQLEAYLPNLLHILLCVCALSSHALDQRHQVAPRLMPLLKTIRFAAITRLNQFFQTFDYYPFSRQEVDAIFDVAVWPQLPRLPTEGVYSPTPLFRILQTWSQQARYIPLLGKRQGAGADALTPLAPVFQLLLTPKVKPGVVTVVMEMVENLLTDDVIAPSEESPAAIDVGETAATPHERADVSLGTSLLLPHVPAILEHLKTVAKALSSAGKKAIPARELNILSRLSQHVTDPQQSAEVVKLLLAFLGRRVTRSPLVEVDVLTSVNNLIRQASDHETFIQPVGRLFGTLTLRAPRTALCTVLQTLALRLPALNPLAGIVSQMNAWDPKRVEEPDYLVRLRGFEQAQARLAGPAGLDTTLLLLLTSNSVFILANVDDLSLRESAAHCLKCLIKRVAGEEGGEGEEQERAEAFKVVILQHLLPEVKVNLKLPVETRQQEFITLLACLVRHFPHHPQFSDLHPLTDKDADADFFNNVVHTQLHRRGQAVRQLIKYINGRTIRSETLVSCLLPIVTGFLRQESYSRTVGVLEAAVDGVGALARQLPWPRYLLLLKYYLAQLHKSIDRQKMVVKILVGILDAFHFDLSKSQGLHAAYSVPLQEQKPDVNPLDKAAEAGEVDKDAVTPEAGVPGPDEPDVPPQEETMGDGEEEEDEEEEGEGEDEGVEKGGTPQAGGEGSAPPPGTPQVCAPGLATRIHRLIMRSILPQLHKSLAQKSQSDDQHKKAGRAKYAEDDEILRVPLALAMIKLLQSLPEGSLHQNLPNVLLKVCHFLRSRSSDIRESARDTLIKIMQSLGSGYFRYVVRELRLSLQKGYQIHVLCFTVWCLLKNLKSSGLKPGDLDPCMGDLVKIFNDELFGQAAEEKEVADIKAKLMEARSSKSLDSYGILAMFVSHQSLAKVVVPLKQELDFTHSQRRAQIVAEALRKIGLGLVDNTGLPLDALLTFVYGLTTQSLPQLNPKRKRKSDAAPDPRARPPSTYLLPSKPRRLGSKPKAHVKTNAHVVVEFGLQLLHLLLKKSRLSPSDVTHQQLIDPFIVPLTECLSSKHVKVTATSLRCLHWLFRFPLPSLRAQVESVGRQLFVLLKNYAVAGAARGDNVELVVMCFKAVTTLVRDVDYHTISSDQLQVLLAYAEQDISDHSRQATAFSLLKAILSRKLVVPEMDDVMGKVQQLSVTADSAHVRLQCRQVAVQFLLDYPLGKKLRRHLEFYVSQLDYEHESGRESALEMLAKIFTDFPQGLLQQYSGLFFLPLCSRLINDESTHCKKLAALAVKTLLGKFDSAERDKLFNISLEWIQNSKAAVRKLGALSCGLFVEVETASFERHLDTLLPILQCQIHPDKYDQDQSNGAALGRDLPEVTEQDNDLLLFSMLNLLLKVFAQCNIVRKAKWADLLADLLGHVQTHLLYPHSWVRTRAAQLFGLLFAAWQPTELIAPPSDSRVTQSAPPVPKKKKKKTKETVQPDESQTKDEPVKFFLQDELEAKLHELCGSFCEQLSSQPLEEEMADQVVKNLIYVGKVLKLMDTNTSTENDDVSAETDDKKKASLRWLVRRMCREAFAEAALSPKVTVKRTCVFKFLAAMALELGSDGIGAYLATILQPLVRESTAPGLDEALRSLCDEALELIKTVAGVEAFTKQFTLTQVALAQRRQARKQQRATEAVANPEIFVKRKMKKHLAKQVAKKRKTDERRVVRRLKKTKH